MAPRPFWKGYLRLSLVLCPIQLFPATSEREKIRFHQINKKTGIESNTASLMRKPVSRSIPRTSAAARIGRARWKIVKINRAGIERRQLICKRDVRADHAAGARLRLKVSVT